MDSLSRVTLTRKPAVISQFEEQDGSIDTVYLGAEKLVYMAIPMFQVDSMAVVASEKRLTDLNVDPVGEYRKKAAEAAAIANAKVEQITDINGLPAVKVSFESGILFGFNSSVLGDQAKASLSELANILKNDTTTDIAIIGHTDKVGTYEANVKVSKNRAGSVENYLESCGVNPAQFKLVDGVAYDQYDESKSADENRRVEVYMYASEEMIKQAEMEEKANEHKRRGR
jgi:outer membrane protein OmpA-like peptidoglycan-associated protein